MRSTATFCIFAACCRMASISALHGARDTSNQRWRAFSAGSVPVQDIFTLAEWIARYEEGWREPGRSQKILDSGQAVDVSLTRAVPVYLVYVTAWSEPDGRVAFRPDIYGRDGAAPTAAPTKDATPAPKFTLTP